MEDVGVPTVPWEGKEVISEGVTQSVSLVFEQSARGKMYQHFDLYYPKGINF